MRLRRSTFVYSDSTKYKSINEYKPDQKISTIAVFYMCNYYKFIRGVVSRRFSLEELAFIHNNLRNGYVFIYSNIVKAISKNYSEIKPYVSKFTNLASLMCKWSSLVKAIVLNSSKLVQLTFNVNKFERYSVSKLIIDAFSKFKCRHSFKLVVSTSSEPYNKEYLNVICKYL